VCDKIYLPRNFKRSAYNYYRAIWDYQEEHRSEIFKKKKNEV